MAEVKGLKIGIGASLDEFKSGLEEVKGSLGGLGDFASSALGLLSNPITLTIGALAGIGTAAFKVGSDFQEAFGIIRVGTGATGQALDGLKGSFETVFATADGDAQMVANAIADLNTRTGATGPLLEGLATQYLQLADIAGMDVQQAIAQSTTAFNAWGVATEDQSGKLDFLFKTSQALGPSVSEITTLVTQNAPALQQLGLGFEQSAVLAGKLQAETGNASAVLSSLNMALRQASEEGIPAREHLNNVIETIKNAKNPAEAAQVAFDNFGRQGAVLADAIRDGRFEIDDLVKSLEASNETIADAEGQSDTLGESFDLLMKNVTVLLAPLGVELVGALTDVVKWLIDAIQFVKNFATSNSDTVTPISTAWSRITETFRTFKTDVEAFLSALVTAWNNDLGGIKTTVETVWGQIKVATEFLFSTLTTIFETAFGVLHGALLVFTGLLTGDWDKAWQGIKKIAESILNGIKGAVENIGKLIIGSVSNLIGGIQQRWESLKNTLVGNSIVPDMMTDIRSEFSDESTVDAASGMLGQVEGKFRTFKDSTTGQGGVFSEWADGIKSITGTLGTDMVKGLFTDPGSFGGSLKDKLGSIKDSFFDVFSTQIGGILDDFIQKGINAVTGALDGLISKLTGTGGVKNALEQTFSNAPTPGVPSGSPSPGGAPSSGSGGGGGIGGVVNMITGIATAISSIFGNFQMAAMNKSLDIIVKHTLQMVNILGGEGQNSGISLKLGNIQEALWWGPLVKTVEDFRNKWFDFGLPVFRALETQGAYIQPTLNDISQHGIWQIERLDRIARNTERAAAAVESMSGRPTGLTLDTLTTAIERNVSGIADTLNRARRPVSAPRPNFPRER